MEKVVWILLLALAALCSCQELHKLEHAFRHQQANQAALLYYQDKAGEPEAALNELRNLWTVHLPLLLAREGENTSLISEACIESTLFILEYGSPGQVPITPNISIPIPGPLSIPLLDATGKPGAGILTENWVLDGAYDECFNYTYTSFCYASKIGIIHNSTTPSLLDLLSFTAGLCVPQNCSAQDIANLVNLTGTIETELADVKCADTKTPGYSVGAIVMMVICGIFVMLVLVGTLVHRAVEYFPGFVASLKPTPPPNMVSINNADEKAPLLAPSSMQMEDKKKKERVSPLDFITAFSLYKTVPTLLATKQAPGVITSLNGLRVISMFYVILGHTYFWIFTFTSARVDNFPALIDVAKRFSFQPVLSAFFAVDSFFFLSGVLVAYLTLRQMKRSKGRFRFPALSYYLHRYLRLTPTYAFVLFFAWFVTVHLSYGPIISLHPGFEANCEKYWWTNFLYINNFYPWNLGNQCVGWTWYLANDMQFYIISPLILIPLYYIFPVGFVISFVMVVCCLVITSTLTAVYDFQANSFAFLAYGYNGHPTSLMTYSDAIYIKPWDRFGPYVVGLLLGFVFYRGVNFSKLRSKLLKLFIFAGMWFVAGLVMLLLVYGLYFTWHGHFPTKVENNIYITFGRILWAASLALIVFASHNGYGFFVNTFLSMPMWTPLARMTFNAYLVHPIVMTVIYGQVQDTIHYTDITIAGYVIVFTVVSYAAAAVVCVVVEFPLGTIEMLFFKLAGLNGRSSQRQADTTLSTEVKALNANQS